MVLVPITAELSLERSIFEILALQGKRVSVRHPLISESLKPESPNISTPRAHTTGLSYGKRPSLDAVWPPPWETDVKRCSVSTIVQDVPAISQKHIAVLEFLQAAGILYRFFFLA
jgi:hypothetical protein